MSQKRAPLSHAGARAPDHRRRGARRRTADRRRHRPRRGHGAGADGRAQRRAGAAVRRDRHRQGDRRPRDPRALDVPQRAVPARELRRDRAGADRLRAVRPRAGRLHRRARRAARAGSSRPNGGTLFLDEIGELRACRRRCGCCASSRTASRARRRRAAGARQRPHRRGDAPRPAARWSRRRRSARTSTTASPCSRSSFRRCAIARTTSARSPSTSRTGRRTASASSRSPVSDDDVRVLTRVSLAGQRARDRGGDGPRRPHRPGTVARGRAPRSVPARVRRPAPSHAVAAAAAPPAGIEPLDVIVRRHIEVALDATRGRVEGPHGAARLLRINPHTLRARMRKLKVDWSRFRAPAGS